MSEDYAFKPLLLPVGTHSEQRSANGVEISKLDTYMLLLLPFFWCLNFTNNGLPVAEMISVAPRVFSLSYNCAAWI